VEPVPGPLPPAQDDLGGLAGARHFEALLVLGGKGGLGRSRDSTGHRGDAIVEAAAMPLTIPDDVLAAAQITEPELKRELALALFQQERLTLAQASSFAEMSQGEFQHLLAERHIPVHYGTEEFEQDLRTLRVRGRL